jgi:hypothetical protein
MSDAKKHRPTLADFKRDPRTGRLLPLGYGSLKGRVSIRKDVDITKPIFEQVTSKDRNGASPTTSRDRKFSVVAC